MSSVPIISVAAPDAQVGGNRLYAVSLWLSLAVCIVQVVSLPILVTFDGYWYARLAEVLGTSRFATEWDYLRTPVFPVLLKAAFPEPRSEEHTSELQSLR